MAFFETIFLTGFPGFIAGGLVKRLAREGARFILLVQPSLALRAREELTSIAEETGVPVDNFSIVQGDITRNGLGLSSAEQDRVRAEASTVFHLAAMYDLAVAREVA